MLLLWLAACGGASDCEMVLSDPNALLSADTQEGILASYAWAQEAMADPAVCLDEIRAGKRSHSLRRQTLRYDADDPSYPSYIIKWAMCSVMEQQRDYNNAGLPWFGDGQRDFAEVCAFGPPRAEWDDVVERACGETALSEVDQFLLDEVYPNAPAGRRDGDLLAEVLPAVSLTDALLETHQQVALVALGEDHLLSLRVPQEGEGTAALLQIDAQTGAGQVVWEGDWDAPAWQMIGGQGGALLRYQATDDAHPRLVSIEPGGAITETVSSEERWLYLSLGAVALGSLWGGSPWQSDALARLDLSDGSLSEIALPEWPRQGTDLLVSQLQPVPDGLVVSFLDADLKVDGDFISIEVYEEILARYRADTGTWTELTRGFTLLSTGSSGALLLGSVYSDAGRALAAYDADTDALYVSDDVCLPGLAPGLSVGSTIYLSDAVVRVTPQG